MQARVLKIILIIMFVLGSGVTSQADIYVWEDDNGVKHFSNDDGAQANENATVHDESTWSAAEEEKWQHEQNEPRLKQKQRMAVNQKIENDQVKKKNKCLEAKAAYEKVKRKYSEFAPEAIPNYAHLPENEIPGVLRERRIIRKRNQERLEQWEKDKKQAYELAEEKIERYCK